MFKKVVLTSLIISTYSYAFTLKEGFLKTLENNPEVQVRANELKKIKYDIDIANGLMYPTLDLTGTAYNARTSTNAYTPKNGNLTKNDEYSLNLNQPLYDGFLSAYEKKLQQHRYESAQYYLKEAQNALALTFTQNYINVLKTKDMLSLSSESYQMSEDIYNKTVRKVERGFGTKLEFERAKGNLEESNVNLAIDRLSYNDAVQSLYNHVQEKFDSTELVKPTFTYNLPHSEEEALAYALSNHPSMLVSLKNVEVAISEQKRDQDSFHPSVNLFGTYTLNDAGHKEHGVNVSNEYQVGIEFAYNLYNGGKDDASNQKALQIVKEKKILIQKSNQEISNRLALAWNSYELNAQKLNRLKEFVKTRRLVLDTTFEEFDLGTKDLGSVIDAHLDFISTKRSVISTTYDLLLAHFRVLEAIGILADEIISDKREEIWGRNTTNIDDVVKKNTEELHFSYATLDNQTEKKEEPKLEYLEETQEIKVDETLKSEVQSAPVVREEPIVQTPSETLTQEPINKIEVEDKKLEESTIETTSSFKERFLNAREGKYTINLATFSTQKAAEQFIAENKIEDSAFSFMFGEEEQYYKVMYGIFDSYAQGKEALSQLQTSLVENSPWVEKITIKQNLYNKYHSVNQEVIESPVETVEQVVQTSNETLAQEPMNEVEVQDKKLEEEKIKEIAVETTNSFKERFLNAREGKYTINLATYSSKENAERFIEKNKIEDNAFSFLFGEDEQYYKVMYGIFDSYAQGQEVLSQLKKGLVENSPWVERITIKQNLYKKYHKN